MTSTPHSIATDDAIRWLRKLPQHSVDLVLSDPPYSSGGFNESQRRGGTSTSDTMPWLLGDALSTPAIGYLVREVALECRRVVRPGGAMQLFTDWKMATILPPIVESAGWRYRALVVWDKGSHGSGQGWLPQHELVMVFADPAVEWHAHTSNVIRCSRISPKAREHVTEKPTNLLVALMRPHVSRGGVVADPFAGSGSLILAADRMGATAWCCDADPQHLPTMERRASRQHSNGDLTLEGAA